MRNTRLSFLVIALALPALAYHQAPAMRAAPETRLLPASPASLGSARLSATVPPAVAGPAVAVTAPARDTMGAAIPSFAADTSFAQLVARLSERGGYFSSDNLISNEASYLHVTGKLARLGVKGGAYIGVGPDQNFSYIARIRPNIAFMLDIRRDNLLHHLLLKSLFEHARNRIEYLCLLFGKPVPRDAERWDDVGIGDLLAYIDTTASDDHRFQRTLHEVATTARGFGFPLSDVDLATISQFHEAFFDEGLDMRFTSYGRAPRAYYPTYRQLLLETNLEGEHANYLVREADFQFLRTMQLEDRIVPVIGDLAGDHALPEIAAWLHENNERVSAFYTSNVEFYLMASGTFDRFARNVERLPRGSNSVIIRSYFGRGYPHPQSVPGYYSTQLLQSMEGFVTDEVDGGYRSYSDLVVRNMLDLRG